MATLFEEFQAFLQGVSTPTTVLNVLEEKSRYIDHVRVANIDDDVTYR
jgi:hypothetical protein